MCINDGTKKRTRHAPNHVKCMCVYHSCIVCVDSFNKRVLSNNVTYFNSTTMVQAWSIGLPIWLGLQKLTKTIGQEYIK